jgi:RecA-family ATPase
VVLVAEEDHKRRMQRRLRMVGRALGIEHRTSDLVIAAQEGANIADERGRGRIAALVRRVKPILVVLDPWRRMTPGVNENDSERVAVLLAWLRRVQVENKCAVMVLDHLRKEQATADKDSSRAAHRIRGSGDKAAWYDSLIMVRRKGDDDPEHTIRALHRDANPLSPQTLRIVWDDERHDLAINLCAPQSPPTKKPERDESREPQEGMAF